MSSNLTHVIILLAGLRLCCEHNGDDDDDDEAFISAIALINTTLKISSGMRHFSSSSFVRIKPGAS